MRSYAPIRPSLWMAGGEVELIKQTHSKNALALYLYLLTNPHAHLSGIYRCPIEFIVKESPLSLRAVKNAFQTLESLSLSFYDTELEIVLIPRMLCHNVGKLAEKDNRVAGINTHLAGLPPTYLIKWFCLANNYTIPVEYKPLTGHLQAPSKGTFLSIPCSLPNPPLNPKGTTNEY